MKLKTTRLFPLILLCLTSCNEVEHNISEYVLEMEYKDDFKILQLSDTHMSNKDDQQRHFDFMSLTVKEAKADLIVVTGDVFTFADKSTAKRTFEWLDSFKTPWTLTWGNHDEQTYFPIDWVTSYLNDLSNSDDSYCIFKDIIGDNVYGNANFAINLKAGNDIKDQIIIIDSNRYLFGDYVGYDSIHNDQIEWYKKLVDYTTTQAGHVVPSFAFFHIPLPEVQTAIDLVKEEKKTNVDNPDVEVLVEQIGEDESVSCPKTNTGMFDAMVEKGSTKAMFFGHDHVCNSAIKYKGIVMSYGIKANNRIYCEQDRLGGQTIVLHNDGSFTIDQIFHTYEEIE